MVLSKCILFFLYISIHCILSFQTEIFAQTGWIQQTSNTSLNLYSVSFSNENTGWAVGDSGIILKSVNGGLNWTSSRFTDIPLPLRAFHFFDENTGVVVGGRYGGGMFGNSPRRLIIKTTNGGNNWQIIDDLFSQCFTNIQFVNDSVGFIGINGVLKTTDKGNTWEYFGGINSNNSFFMNESTGYATSANSPMIYKTTNGGFKWILIYYTGLYNFGGGIFFCNLNTGYVIGHSTIFKTTDAGNSWENKINIDYNFRDAVYFSEPNRGVVLANTAFPNYYTIIQATTNGGNSWQNNYTSVRLNSVFFINNNTGWTVGNGGRILKTTTGGSTFVTQSSTFIPDKFSLHQNYPNPFNPKTNIEFEIPAPEFVVIRIFNNLGREVTTIVNEFLNEGVFKVEFNTSNLESGVYYYRMQAGNFIETKSMILLK